MTNNDMWPEIQPKTVMATPSPDMEDKITLCPICNCMTYTVSREFEQQCGKCGADKNENSYPVHKSVADVNTSSEQTIDNILDYYFAPLSTSLHSKFKDSVAEAKAQLSAMVNAAVAAALDRVEKEVIGESQPWNVSNKDYGFKDQGKNELRVKQRQALDALRKELLK